MADRISKERRSWNMSRIRGKDTGPEKHLRSLVHKAGYRYRLHRADLPGRPDLVFPRYGAVVFVNGCYWHRHKGCPKATTPKTRPEFWEKKFQGTVERDRRNAAALKDAGWHVITVWECQLEKHPGDVLRNVTQQLEEGRHGP